MGTVHHREWQFDKNHISITDKLQGKIESGMAHLHFAAGLEPEKTENEIHIENIRFIFKGETEITLIKTKIPDGYNQFQNSYKAEITFKNELIIKIKINQ
jgi:hypothetical protein